MVEYNVKTQDWIDEKVHFPDTRKIIYPVQCSCRDKMDTHKVCHHILDLLSCFFFAVSVS
jgi:hypothetical protein